MIKLQKLPVPERLSKHAEKWTKELLHIIESGEKPTDAQRSHYRHPDIKDVLVLETHGKCAYCECRLQHIHHGDVEHIYPKSLAPARTFEWDNLTLACEICNQNKRDLDPNVEHIIDPYRTDPEPHFLFIAGLIFANGTNEGHATRALLKLHRPELTEARHEHAARIMQIYEKVVDTTLPLAVRRAIYDDLIESETSARSQFAAMVRSLVKMMEARLPNDLQQAS